MAKKSKPLKISAVVTTVLVIGYVVLLYVQPAIIIRKILHISFNSPERVDSVFYKYTIYLIFAGVSISLLLWLFESKYRQPLVTLIASMVSRVSSVLSVNALLGISIIYLVVLFCFAVTHYDLGFDEAWYLCWAKNFAATGIPFYTAGGKIALIDNITMLPYYLLSVINFKSGLTDIIYFKLLSSVLSGLSLFVMYRVSSGFFDRAVAVLFLFILIIQPGFGFIASSFFGEIPALAFIFLGLYYWLKDGAHHSNHNIYLAAALFSIAVNTKFQLLMILPVVLIVLHYTDKNSKPLKVLLWTIIFTASIVIIRSIPAVISDPKLFMNLLSFTFFGDNTGHLLPISDKLQLYNRFFPLSVLLISLGVFFFYMQTTFERFLFLFASLISFWWILLYPYSTYRNPFMGLVPLSVIIAILLVKLFKAAETGKPLLLKYAVSIVVIIFMLYGFSANIIYAYIGYNDGVQFDLDGYRSRLLTKIEYNSTQKDFYEIVKTRVRPLDTLYNGSFVTSFYLDNPVASVFKLKESLSANTFQPVKYLLITRDFYPLGLEKGREQLDSLGANWKLEVKTGEFEMYSVKK